MAILQLAACDQRELATNERKPVMSDQQMKIVEADYPGMSKQCLIALRWGGIAALPRNFDECFVFSKPVRMSGLWRTYFEGSLFCPAPAKTCEPREAGSGPNRRWVIGTWFELKDKNVRLPSSEKSVADGETHLYAVEFIGRRNIGVGGFGHLGLAANQVIADKVISIRELPEPRRTGEQ